MLRNSSVLKRQTWLWGRVEPVWNAFFSRVSGRSGYPARIGPFELRLEYEIGARYDRADKNAYEPIGIFHAKLVQP